MPFNNKYDFMCNLYSICDQIYVQSTFNLCSVLLSILCPSYVQSIKLLAYLDGAENVWGVGGEVGLVLPQHLLEGESGGKDELGVPQTLQE